MSEARKDALRQSQRQAAKRAAVLAHRARAAATSTAKAPSIPVVGELTPVKVLIGGALFVGALLLIRRATR